MNLKSRFKKIKKTSLIIYKNISIKLGKNKAISFISDNKYPFIFVTIISIFIGKNIFLLGMYSRDIASLENDVKHEEAVTSQIKQNIKYYKTDEFVYRYALENLNMRPTKKSKLIHIDIKDSNKDDSNNNDLTDNDSSNDNSNENNINNNSGNNTNETINSNSSSSNESTSD